MYIEFDQLDFFSLRFRKDLQEFFNQNSSVVWWPPLSLIYLEQTDQNLGQPQLQNQFSFSSSIGFSPGSYQLAQTAFAQLMQVQNFVLVHASECRIRRPAKLNSVLLDPHFVRSGS